MPRAKARYNSKERCWTAECADHSTYVRASSKDDANYTETEEFCDECRTFHLVRQVALYIPHRAMMGRTPGVSGDSPCAVCGAQVDPSKAWWIRTIGGGSMIPIAYKGPMPEGWDTGCYPVGPECRKGIATGYLSRKPV
jgi:hypothetical protein